MKDFEADYEKEFAYEKSPLWKKFEGYQKNLLCIQDVSDRLLGHMKGHVASFRQEITDGKGNFSQEKLSGFVDELLSRWAKKQREGTFTDPSTGESMVEAYIRARQELYGCYLYLSMRCSLCRESYTLMTGGSLKERTDFAFLLEQAKWFMRAWCVVKEKDGSKKNQMFWGYDGQFGFHLYRVLSNSAAGYDNGFDLIGHLPMDHPASLTDEGNVKRRHLKRIYAGHSPWPLEGKAEKMTQPDGEDMARGGCGDEDGYDREDSYDGKDGHSMKGNYGGGDIHDMDGSHGDGDVHDMDGSYGYKDIYDMEYSPDEEEGYDEDGYDEDGWEYPEMHDAAWYEADYEIGQREAQKYLEIENLALGFEHREEYVGKCVRFVELFQQAGQDVLREFCEDLEEIVALYLAERDIPPVMDTDKALDVYSGIYDGPCRRAERYARGIQWENM